MSCLGESSCSVYRPAVLREASQASLSSRLMLSNWKLHQQSRTRSDGDFHQASGSSMMSGSSQAALEWDLCCTSIYTVILFVVGYAPQDPTRSFPSITL